jgi:hypothetical protein
MHQWDTRAIQENHAETAKGGFSIAGSGDILRAKVAAALGQMALSRLTQAIALQSEDTAVQTRAQGVHRVQKSPPSQPQTPRRDGVLARLLETKSDKHYYWTPTFFYTRLLRVGMHGHVKFCCIFLKNTSISRMLKLILMLLWVELCPSRRY